MLHGRLARRKSAGPNLPARALMTDDDRLSASLTALLAMPAGSLVVVRSRKDSRRAELAGIAGGIARRHGLAMLIADDPDLAARSGAVGAHFPERRAGRLAHWRVRRPHWLLTASAHSLAAAIRAARFGADAVFLSPVFPTASHPGRTALGPVRLRLMAAMLPVPVYALGGIDPVRARRLTGARLAGLAGISGIREARLGVAPSRPGKYKR